MTNYSVLNSYFRIIIIVVINVKAAWVPTPAQPLYLHTYEYAKRKQCIKAGTKILLLRGSMKITNFRTAFSPHRKLYYNTAGNWNYAANCYNPK